MLHLGDLVRDAMAFHRPPLLHKLWFEATLDLL